MTHPPAFTIRPATRADLPELYQVCLATGDAGRDAQHLHDDQDLLGNLFVGPYVALEPQLAFALEDQLGVCGYVLGALDTADFLARYAHEWLPHLQARTPEPPGESEGMSPSDRLRWRIHHPPSGLPLALARFPSHLHIDLLPRAQGRGQGRAMVELLLETLTRQGSRGVHLEMDPANARAKGFYSHLGFEPVESDELPPNTLYLARRLNARTAAPPATGNEPR